jgi:hypothetical protein
MYSKIISSGPKKYSEREFQPGGPANTSEPLMVQILTRWPNHSWVRTNSCGETPNARWWTPVYPSPGRSTSRLGPMRTVAWSGRSSTNCSNTSR